MSLSVVQVLIGGVVRLFLHLSVCNHTVLLQTQAMKKGGRQGGGNGNWKGLHGKERYVCGMHMGL